MLSDDFKLCHSNKRIALVDCNNFYVSCERAFCPSWRNKPVGVLSNNDGCIISRSQELKDAGIPMGAPYFKIQKDLKQLGAIVVSSNYELYGDMSARVMNTLAARAPEIEIYSIDEAWLDLTQILPNQLHSTAQDTAQQVFQNTGIPVSIGIGQTKVLAKIANRICKKRNIKSHSKHNVFTLGDIQTLAPLLQTFPVEDLWGIGRRWAAKLHSMSIKSAYDLQQANPDLIRKRFGVVMQRILYELRGYSCLSFEEVQPKKQIIASRAFGQKVTSKTALSEALTLHTTRASEKLRAQNSVAKGIGIHIRSSPFTETGYWSKSHVQLLPTPTADTRKLLAAVQKSLNLIYKPGIQYAKAGVWIFEISNAQIQTLDFFDEQDSEQSQALMQTFDALNQRFGKNTVFFGTQGTQQQWQMRRNKMTPRYTTNWEELPTVK